MTDMTTTDSPSLLSVRNLAVDFAAYQGTVQAVRGVSFDVKPASTLAIVGESGCGKSVTAMALLGLIPRPAGRIKSGQALFRGQDLLSLDAHALNQIRGSDIAMIFQDPMSALNPTMRVGQQIAEPLIVHRGKGRAEAMSTAIDLLERAHITEARARAKKYPLEYSGGMLQRAMIATALSCQPSLLILDEPTTALDVTIQAQILALMQDLQKDQAMAMILITHDLGVVAKMAEDVVVMYAGQIVETGSAEDIFYRSAHPYTLGLRQAIPVQAEAGQRIPLKPIDGSPPDLYHPPTGCGYSPRCPYAMRLCQEQAPPDVVLAAASPSRTAHKAKCWLQHPAAPAPAPNNGATDDLQLYRAADAVV